MCSKASKQGGRASSLNHSGGLETVWHGSSPAHLSSSQACFIRWAYLAPSSRREASCAKGSLSLRTSTECGGCERRTELLLEGGGIQIYYKGEKTHEKADVKSPCTRQRLETGYPRTGHYGSPSLERERRTNGSRRRPFSPSVSNSSEL